jgi:hypothetical protein
MNSEDARPETTAASKSNVDKRYKSKLRNRKKYLSIPTLSCNSLLAIRLINKIKMVRQKDSKPNLRSEV